MWVTQSVMDSFNTAIGEARSVYDDANAVKSGLETAKGTLDTAKSEFIAVMEVGMIHYYLVASPGTATEIGGFDQTFTLTLSRGSFYISIGAGDITLGGDFNGLTVATVARMPYPDTNKVTVRISGQLHRSSGIGEITISASKISEEVASTAKIIVAPKPAPATAATGISMKEGADGSGTELMTGFDANTLSYSLQVAKETAAVKIAVNSVAGTTVKVLLGTQEISDGVIALAEGSNTVYVVVSELERSDRIYEITIQRGLVDECFIATAAFGSKFEPAVAMLRHFRDQYLLTNQLGTAFVKFYYRHSPPIARWIAGNDNLRMFTRIALTPFIVVVYLIYHPVAAAVTGLGLLLLLILYYRRRRRIVIQSNNKKLVKPNKRLT
jgi:hypothetical protein